jgi:tol-pal system protein YbgF
MKPLCSLPVSWLILLLFSIFILSACIPSPGGPSTNLEKQIAQMQQQQSRQAEQISMLQRQLQQVQKIQPGESATAAAPQLRQSQGSTFSAGELEPLKIPAAAKRELSALADSASSYLAAFSSLAAGRYSEAESGFNSFLTNFPEHQYSPNARYWLASAQTSQGKLQAASSNLRQVVSDSKGQDRAPAALVLLAKIYRQQRFDKEADEVLEQLRSRYPESIEAQQFYRSNESQ